MKKASVDPGDILSVDSREVISRMRSIFSEVDGKIEELKGLTGVHCPPMCGICCESLKVETTLIEMMPLAEELWRNNEADIWLDKLNRTGDMFSCVFFRKDTEVPGNGRCLVYVLRPLICRLFGFFTIRDKNGNYDYGSCIVMKKKYPDSYQKAVQMVREGAHPSNVTDYSIRVISMGAGVNSKMLPINIASKMAIEKIGFEIIKNKWGKEPNDVFFRDVSKNKPKPVPKINPDLSMDTKILNYPGSCYPRQKPLFCSLTTGSPQVGYRSLLLQGYIQYMR